MIAESGEQRAWRMAQSKKLKAQKIEAGRLEDERKRGQKIVKKSRVSYLRLFLWVLVTEGRGQS